MLHHHSLRRLNCCRLVDWTGNLDTYEVEIVESGQRLLTAQTNV